MLRQIPGPHRLFILQATLCSRSSTYSLLLTFFSLQSLNYLLSTVYSLRSLLFSAFFLPSNVYSIQFICPVNSLRSLRSLLSPAFFIPPTVYSIQFISTVQFSTLSTFSTLSSPKYTVYCLQYIDHSLNLQSILYSLFSTLCACTTTVNSIVYSLLSISHSLQSIIYSSRILCLSFVLSYSCRPIIFAER